jgi:hypothetical protein
VITELPEQLIYSQTSFFANRLSTKRAWAAPSYLLDQPILREVARIPPEANASVNTSRPGWFYLALL